MKKICLTNSRKKALVDAAYFKLVKRFKWHLQTSPDKRLVYARNGRLGLMHRFLMGYPTGSVDHINGCGLDNTLKNLRKCTHQQNMWNTHHTGKKFKGVFCRRNAHHYSYFAYIRCKGVQYHLGTFQTDVEAAKAYNRAAKRFFGRFAQLNKV
jgi:hypothetical protein